MSYLVGNPEDRFSDFTWNVSNYSCKTRFRTQFNARWPKYYLKNLQVGDEVTEAFLEEVADADEDVSAAISVKH